MRIVLVILFTTLTIAGIATVSGALGGLTYNMPLYRGVKQILIGGIALGVGLGGRYALR